jgi:hypothetical protein
MPTGLQGDLRLLLMSHSHMYGAGRFLPLHQQTNLAGLVRWLQKVGQR